MILGVVQPRQVNKATSTVKGACLYGHSNRTPQLVSRGRWKPSAAWAVAMATLAMVAFYRMMIAGYEEFLYRFF